MNAGSTPDSVLELNCSEWLRHHSAERALWAQVHTLLTEADQSLSDQCRSRAQALEQEAEAVAVQQAERRRDICEMPAMTIQGLYSKALVLQADGFLFPGKDGLASASNFFAQLIFADIEKLATNNRTPDPVS